MYKELVACRANIEASCNMTADLTDTNEQDMKECSSKLSKIK